MFFNKRVCMLNRLMLMGLMVSVQLWGGEGDGKQGNGLLTLTSLARQHRYSNSNQSSTPSTPTPSLNLYRTDGRSPAWSPISQSFSGSRSPQSGNNSNSLSGQSSPLPQPIVLHSQQSGPSFGLATIRSVNVSSKLSGSQSGPERVQTPPQPHTNGNNRHHQEPTSPFSPNNPDASDAEIIKILQQQPQSQSNVFKVHKALHHTPTNFASTERKSPEPRSRPTDPLDLLSKRLAQTLSGSSNSLVSLSSSIAAAQQDDTQTPPNSASSSQVLSPLSQIRESQSDSNLAQLRQQNGISGTPTSFSSSSTTTASS